MVVTAEFLFSGMGDYWSGNADRWDDNAGCLFASYDGQTTLKQIVESLVDDYNNGGDCESMWDDVSDLDVKVAILASLTDKSLADYHSGAIAECSKDYAEINELYRCRHCNEKLGELHDPECDYVSDFDEDDEGDVREEECEVDDYDNNTELPVVIFLIKYESCPDCGAPSGKYTTSNLCNDCNCKHYGATAGICSICKTDDDNKHWISDTLCEDCE